MSRLTLAAAAAVLAAAGAAAPAAAQERPAMSVGRISAVQSCTYFRESAGSAGVVATPYAVAGYASWRTWWVKDCVDNFATMRSSLEAALAASGGVDMGSRGGYVISASLSDVSGGPGGAAPRAPDTGDGGFSVATSGMRINADVTVKDRNGRIVFGTLLTKTIETGYDVRAGGIPGQRQQFRPGSLRPTPARGRARNRPRRGFPLQSAEGGQQRRAADPAQLRRALAHARHDDPGDQPRRIYRRPLQCDFVVRGECAR